MYPQYPPQNTPKASVGAVNIQIYNPSVSGNGTQQSPIPNQTMPRQYYAPAPYYYPVNPNIPRNMAQNVKQTVNTAPSGANVVSNTTNNNTTNPQNPIASTSLANSDKTKKKKKEIVQLTDSYIKTLENYLRNPNAEIRQDAANQLLQRFKEEKTRRNDVALTNLLNVTLQDPSSNVRLLGLATLNSGYALGDKNTINLLKGIQKTDNVYNQDAILASNVLLKMSGKKIEVETDEIEEPKNKTDKKTN